MALRHTVSVPTTDAAIDRDTAISWYRKNRARTAELFSLLTDDAYYERPIALRHPVVFYEGHLPAFSVNTLVKKAHGRAGVDERLERLFARGIDPDESNPGDAAAQWPSRDEVRQYVEAADALVLDALAHLPLADSRNPLLQRADAVYSILEHEAMHQETLLYMWHRLDYSRKRAPAGYQPATEGQAPRQETIHIDAMPVSLGTAPGAIPFGWDNEFGRAFEQVDAFRIDRFKITNAMYLEFVDAGGYRNPDLWSAEDWRWLQQHQITHPTFWSRAGGDWQWRGMFASFPLPPHWPVYVSHAEASAFAKWRGRRLPTEAEYRAMTWPFPTPGVCDFESFEPRPVGSRPEAATPAGVDEPVGNGWEWTATVFAPFEGFVPGASYPEYSADFFDGSHFVMKGASPVTARELIRPTFRNWFRPRYPYVYATFRLAGDAA
jgi:gamma-glutamyl hercynylcysteine S-oxide synthase